VKAFLHLALVGAAVVPSFLLGCRGDVSSDPPVLLERNMFDQERYNPQGKSEFFADHRTMRAPVEGTFEHFDTPDEERFMDNPVVSTGMDLDGNAYVPAVPQLVIDKGGGLEALVNRGQERFNIYCAPCHSRKGDGNGPVAQHGFANVKHLGDQTVRDMPDGQLFATITRGKTTMPAYAAQIPVRDRWAIVAYVRALQLTLPTPAAPAPTPSAPTPAPAPSAPQEKQ